MAPMIWVGLGILGGLGIAVVVVLGAAAVILRRVLTTILADNEWATSTIGTLPTFDDDEAQKLLEAGA